MSAATSDVSDVDLSRVEAAVGSRSFGRGRVYQVGETTQRARLATDGDGPGLRDLVAEPRSLPTPSSP